MKKYLHGTIALLLSIVSFIAPASAAQIVSVGGSLLEVPAPAVLTFNGTGHSGVTNPNPIIFNQYTDVAIPTFSAIDPNLFTGADFLNVDIVAPGTFPPGGQGNNFQLASGTMVSSYIMNFEPSDSSSSVGSVTFDSDVLAIQTQFFLSGFIRNLYFDQPTANPSNYPTLLYGSTTGINLFGSTGLELYDGPLDPISATMADQLTLSADRRTVSFALNVIGGGSDTLRIFVAPTAVAEPSTWEMLLLGLLGVGFMVRGARRKDVATA